MGRAAPDIPDGMREIHGHFARWRKSHTGRLPIPQPLWAAAAEMARRHGVFRTSQVLSLEYGKLKRMVQSEKPIAKTTAPTSFVELVAPPVIGRSECLIELEGPRGKMRIQWKGTTGPDLAGLSRTLWERR